MLATGDLLLEDTINGSGAGPIIVGVGQSFSCIVVNSSSTTMKGLEITNCDRGINLFKTTGPDTNDNVIGGTTADERNVIYDNFIGVLVNGEITRNRVIGNYLGFNPNDATAEGNDWGVFVGPNADGNFIGGDTPGERNVISGNVEAGIAVRDSE